MLATLVVSCGGGGGNAVRPKDFTANEAMGDGNPTCKGKPAFTRPLIVDLESDTRSDLEAAMDKGLVVVAYDCANLRVLNNCKAPSGDYDYGRVSRKEEVVQIKALDDLKVNMPIGAAKLSGEVSAGRSIDLALVSIGRQSTTIYKVGKSELKGDCAGATHFVTKAYLGAFSLSTGSSGKVVAVAELFSRGGSAASSTEKSGSRSDGSLDACRKAESDSPKPTVECKTALRVELTPLGEEKTEVLVGAKEAKRRVEVLENPCPEGFKLVEGLCAKPSAAAKRGYLCDPKNADECKTECSKGNPGSCTNAGALALRRFPESPWEQVSSEALPLFKKACEAGDANGCAGILKSTIVDDDKPGAEAQIKELAEIGKKACEEGSAAACEEVGVLTHPDLHSGKKWADAETSAKYFERGCRLGNALACGAAGKVVLAKDVTRGVALYQRGCDGGDADVCNALAVGLIEGKRGISKDVERGVKLASHACELNIETCAKSAGVLADAGKHDDALRYAQRGCEDKDPRTLDKEEQDSAKGKRGLACAYLGQLYADGIGTAKDPTKAAAAFKAGCDAGETSACDSLKKGGAKAKPKTKPKGKR